MKKLSPLLSATAVVGATAIGHAATIDFTDASTGSLANGKSSYTYTDVGGTNVDITVSANSGAKISAQTGTGLSADGLGVNSGGWDQGLGAGDNINGKESLTVSFSEEVTIASVSLTDLYSSQVGQLIPDKTGTWTLVGPDGTVSGTFSGDQNVMEQGTLTNGVLSLDIGQIASSIVFQSTTSGIGSQYRGFSVASISFDKAGGGSAGATPELSATGASSAALVLAGVAILFSGNKRRRLLGPQS